MSADMSKILSCDCNTATVLKIPIFSAWIVKEAGCVNEILKVALDIREDSPIKEARQQIQEIRSSIDSNDLQKRNRLGAKLKRQLGSASKNLCKKYSIEVSSGSSNTSLIQVYNMAASLLNLPKLDRGIKINMPEILKDKLTPNGFAQLYRNIGKDLSQVWGLRELRDKLGASVQLEQNRSVYNPKTESPGYKNYHSQWKSPM